jgi:hypothetical protein
LIGLLKTLTFSGQNLNVWNVNKHEKNRTPNGSLQIAVKNII